MDRHEREGSFLVPWSGDGKLAPAQRRVLTKRTADNPLLHEVASIIPLEPEEVQQIRHWVHSASSSIIAVGEILVSHPGEVTTSSQEQRDTTSEQETTGSSRTVEKIKIRGFFTISIDAISDTSQQGTSRTETREERSGTQIAKTRPGQFLTGGQIQDALQRVVIARDEGTLLLPAVSSELNRRQSGMLSTTKRVIQDHRTNNPDWAEDIQEGAISGLIEQLGQVSNALRDGYMQGDIEISKDGQETIHTELRENGEATLRHLVEFSLLPTTRISSVEKAASALRRVVLEDIFPIAPEEAITLLDIWREIFAREAQGESARSIGVAFGEVLSSCILQSQERKDGAFDGLSEVAKKAAEAGGAELLLHTFVNVIGAQSPNERSATLFSSFIDQLPLDRSNLREETIVTAIRFLVETNNGESSIQKIKELLDKLSELGYGACIQVQAGGRRFSWSSIEKLVKSLSEEHWQEVRRMMKAEGASWAIAWNLGHIKDNSGMIPSSIEVMGDPDIVLAVRTAFAREIRNAMLPSDGRARVITARTEREDLRYMYHQCDEETRKELRELYAGRAVGVTSQARIYLLSHEVELTRLTSIKEADKTWRGELMHELLAEIGSTSFFTLPVDRQLKIMYDAFDRLRWHSGKIRHSIRFPSINPLSKIRVTQASSIIETVLKSNEFFALEEEISRFFWLKGVFSDSDN